MEELLKKYASAVGTLMGGIHFLSTYDSYDADRIRKELKELEERIKKELE